MKHITLKVPATDPFPLAESATQANPETQTSLCWGAFDANGKLRAMLESESEAYYYVRNRSHMHGGSHKRIASPHRP